MADINASTLMTSSFLTESVKQAISDSNNYIGNAELPIEEQNSNYFKVKVNKNTNQPINDVAGGASHEVANIRGNNLIKYQGIPFKKKIVLTEDDEEYLEMLQYLEGFKEINPSSQVEVQNLMSKHENLLASLSNDASSIIEEGVEKLRWQALSGSITTTNYGSISYNFAGARTPSAGTVWSDTASATPVTNIQSWKREFRASGYRPKGVYMNQKTYDEMVNTSQVLSFIQGTNSSEVLMSEGRVTRILGLDIVIYDEFYNSTEDPDNPTMLPFIPDDKVFILGENKRGGGLGRFFMGPTVGNSLNPGMYVNVQDMSQADPQKVEIRFGFKGLPALHFDNGDGVVYASV